MSTSTTTTTVRVAKELGRSADYPIGTTMKTHENIVYMVVQDKNGNHRWMKKDKIKKSKEDVKPAMHVVSETDSDSDTAATVQKKTKTTKKIDVKVKEEVKKNLTHAFDDVATITKHTRKAPKAAASTYEEGETEIGLDGNVWSVKVTKNGVKRWIAM